ncbi:hypothetical protein HanXRQr2_Chr02g0083851 [Helianthus annuus]|uniref:Uncharacterized protein n=1 Tax=Helianthus annuus TaxID=4232 RepID=A0A9K3JRG0_HELAN|nr:hypothetical protein HanXRQr2_Chr02g0083851 [Helianthus annuus]KAJ0953206.1 hypothetical protein HanPSC8_Chr02g0081241 [Helianthus annuus]
MRRVCLRGRRRKACAFAKRKYRRSLLCLIWYRRRQLRARSLVRGKGK